jgi:hypothetical protein
MYIYPHFLHKHNHKRREVAECGRKLLLTGFSVFFGVGSVMQAVLGILVTLFYVVLVSHLNPYSDSDGTNNTNNQLAVIEHTALLIVLLQVVMIKYYILAEAVPGGTPAYEPGYSADFINAILVSTLAGTGLFSGVMMAVDLMRTRTGSPPAAAEPDGDTSAAAAAAAAAARGAEHQNQAGDGVPQNRRTVTMRQKQKKTVV